LSYRRIKFHWLKLAQNSLLCQLFRHKNDPQARSLRVTER